jgi:ribosomal RNA-processing protein 8
MPHKKRANRNHVQVKKILANSELSLLDKKKPKRSFERVPRYDNNPADRKREEQILNDDSDDDKKKKKVALKKHINKELEQQNKPAIPKKSRKNKYYLMNHPELKGVIVPTLPKTIKRKHDTDEQNEPPKKKLAEETKPSICDKLVSHMITSRFRYLNEKLYTSTSTEAQKLFQKDPQSFYAYHQGYSVSFVLPSTIILFIF